MPSNKSTLPPQHTPPLSGFRKLLAGAACAAVALSAACGGDGDDPDTDGGLEPIELRGSCDEADHIGAFQIAVATDFSSVDGQIHDGVLPITVRQEVESDGDCKLMRRLNPFCDPSCSGEQVCNHDGTCSARPEPQDVGVVTITGLEEAISMEPRAPGNNYFATPETNPIFVPDAELRLRTSAGAYGELALSGLGFEPLGLPSGDWTLRAETALELTWDAPTLAEISTRVFFELTIDQHGTSPVALQCDFPDTGSATVAASLVDALLAEGVSGFPNGSATRRTTDRMTVADGCIDLTVASPVPNSVAVDGHTPCDDPTDCPDGQTCDIPNETCVDE